MDRGEPLDVGIDSVDFQLSNVTLPPFLPPVVPVLLPAAAVQEDGETAEVVSWNHRYVMKVCIKQEWDT